MEELEKYLNKCYIEREKENIFVYRFVKVTNKYGFLCFEARTKPENVYVYTDFPDDQEGSIGFIKSFIPELDKECQAKEISESHYYELITTITRLNVEQRVVNQKIRNFIKNYGLDEKV